MTDKKPSTYRILSVDPGTRNVGVAVLELGQGFKPHVLHHGVLRTQRAAPVCERLRDIYDGLSELVREQRPDVVVVEDVFYGKNVQSALRIGEGRGVVLLAAALAGREVVEYPPATIKQAVCGNGRASKAQVHAMVCRLLELSEPPESSDASDALAIGFCHAQRIRAGVGRSRPARRRSSARAIRAMVERLGET